MVSNRCQKHFLRALTIGSILLSSLAAQDGQSARDWASLVGQRFRAERDVVYRSVNGFNAKVDLYIPYDLKPGLTIVYIHGGGWSTGSKEQYVLWFLPYLQLGMRVVAVQYRLAGVAPAPAGVEDCRCALKWVFQNAGKYGIDPKRIVLTGGSAGGHLVLMTGMLRASDGFDVGCPGPEPPQVAAIINYYGPTDLVSAFDRKDSNLMNWLRGVSNAKEMARRLSPLTYVRPGLPPILTLHGDADEIVPYEDALKLRTALNHAGVPNELLTSPGGKHGRFRWSDETTIKAQRTIEAFLRKYAIE